MAAKPRGFTAACLDKAFTWFQGIEPETSSYTVQSLRIPIEDDLSLAAELYIPIGQKPKGTILVRSPYGIGVPGSLGFIRIFAARGFQVLANCCRGTFGSDGIFEPARNEASDGHKVVQWMREQPWYTGSFATLGASYLGFTQWALLSKPPEDMRTAVILTGPHDFNRFVWSAGALNSDIITWADIQPRLEGSLLGTIMALRSSTSRLRPVFDSIPLLAGVRRLFDNKPPVWLENILFIPSPEYEASLGHSEALERSHIPILLTTGWQDIVLEEVMYQYRTLTARGAFVKLIIGDWSHLGAQRSYQDYLDWLNIHLSDHAEQLKMSSEARIYVTGSAQWENFDIWPPKTESLSFFLDRGTTLCSEVPSMTTESTFDFDPHNPTPSVAHPLLFDNGPGRAASDKSLTNRSDILIFTTMTLTRDVTILGRPILKLYHTTSLPDADLYIALSQLQTNGTARTISEKYLRLTKTGDMLRIELSDCAHKFDTGTRLRLLIAGGSHPRYIRNLGSGEDPITGATLQSVRHTIKHGGTVPSRLVLPVAPMTV